ncbi:uncharacterized protein F5Z01DRAFT_235110 [Emericellopsis atlantica]|uniref:Uncharacterized protein n=1 Tax=Emericellopsis atlantica TaxID=2614577 RepID=A0A9P7ZHF3_9HYPO|nr:uncharacterized protein F5Z01DRAFT_235110 [Emericellopsis atlantica]KAG9252173.1 hypothetical protein F5Z01DRAFT_235110 [Emericellopsis atlantica]
MGKFDTPPGADPNASSSISLHSQPGIIPPQPRYFDDDPSEIQNDDLPPLYSDHENDAVATEDPLLPAGTQPLQVQPFKVNNGVEYYIDRRLDVDPVFLKDHIDRLAIIPPRPHVHIRGTHNSSVRKADGKTERREIVDFDIHIELTHLLYEDIHSRTPFSHEIVTAGNFEKVRRGTVCTTRAPGFGGSGGAAEEGTPDVAEWCRRYCTAKNGLKSFGLERTVSGWDFDALQTKLEGLVRSTNYRGKLEISFPVQNGKVEIYNECRTNRWRLTKWIEMIFVLTLMFIFSWPWLYFRTAKWEVVTAQWRFSVTDAQGRRRYATVSEDRWYNMWARPISRAVLGRRQGTLDQGDLNREDAPREEGFAGVVQAGVDAMGVVNRSFGWGGNDS